MSFEIAFLTYVKPLIRTNRAAFFGRFLPHDSETVMKQF